MITLISYPFSIAVSQTNFTNNLSLDETYDSNGIQIKYPFQWEVVEPTGSYLSNSTNVANFRSPLNNNTLNIVVEKLSQKGITIDDYVENGINYLNSSAMKVKNVESSDSTLAGNPAKNIIFTITNGSNTYKVMEVVTIKDNTAYVITYLGSKDQYPINIQTANNMVDSFEIGSSFSWDGIMFLILFVVFFGAIIAFIAYVIKKLAQNVSSSLRRKGKRDNNSKDGSAGSRDNNGKDGSAGSPF